MGAGQPSSVGTRAKPYIKGQAGALDQSGMVRKCT